MFYIKYRSIDTLAGQLLTAYCPGCVMIFCYCTSGTRVETKFSSPKTKREHGKNFFLAIHHHHHGRRNKNKRYTAHAKHTPYTPATHTYLDTRHASKRGPTGSACTLPLPRPFSDMYAVGVHGMYAQWAFAGRICIGRTRDVRNERSRD